jgi:hypothetical protein
MIRQGGASGPPIREGGIGSNFPAPPAQGGRANSNVEGDKKFVDRGEGDNCGSPGPQR